MDSNGGKNWEVYLLRCADGSLYTGIARDALKRLKAHNSGKGAKYTRARLPVEIVYRETCPDHSSALKREAAIKRLSRPEKLLLLNAWEGTEFSPPSG